MSLITKAYLKGLEEFCQQRKKYLKEVNMHAKFEKDKTFKNELVKHFDRNRKTSYGKNQIVVIIKDLWIKHLEMLVENRKVD